MAVFCEKNEGKSDREILGVYCIIGVESKYHYTITVTNAMEQ